MAGMKVVIPRRMYIKNRIVRYVGLRNFGRKVKAALPIAAAVALRQGQRSTNVGIGSYESPIHVLQLGRTVEAKVVA